MINQKMPQAPGVIVCLTERIAECRGRVTKVAFGLEEVNSRLYGDSPASLSEASCVDGPCGEIPVAHKGIDELCSAITWLENELVRIQNI